MTAPQHSQRKPAKSIRTRTSNSQRIFMKADEIAEAPPVLFRVPSVGTGTPEDTEFDSVESSSQRPAADDSVNQSSAGPHDETRHGQPSQPGDSATQETPIRFDIRKESQTTLGPGAPHFSLHGQGGMAGNDAGADQRVEQNADRITRNDPRLNLAAELAAERQANEQAESLPLVTESTRVPSVAPETVHETQARATEKPDPASSQPTEPTRSKADPPKVNPPQDANPQIPPVAPVPAGRSWMETMGSRLIPVVLIGAVAAYAMLVNQGNEQTPEVTLADLEISEGTPAINVDGGAGDIAAEKNPAAISGNTVTNQPTGGRAAQAGSSPNAALGSLTAPGSDARAAEPDFNLADLVGDDADFSAQGNQETSPQEPYEADALAGPITSSQATSNAYPPLREPEDPSDTQPSSWQDELDLVAEQNGIASAEQRMAARPDTHSQTGDSNASGPTMLNPYERTERDAVNRSELAIEAAVSAALDGQFAPDPSNAGSAATDSTLSAGQTPTAYPATADPAAIEDWSQYLPSPTYNGATSGSGGMAEYSNRAASPSGATQFYPQGAPVNNAAPANNAAPVNNSFGSTNAASPSGYGVNPGSAPVPSVDGMIGSPYPAQNNFGGAVPSTPPGGTHANAGTTQFTPQGGARYPSQPFTPGQNDAPYNMQPQPQAAGQPGFHRAPVESWRRPERSTGRRTKSPGMADQRSPRGSCRDRS